MTPLKPTFAARKCVRPCPFMTNRRCATNERVTFHARKRYLFSMTEMISTPHSVRRASGVLTISWNIKNIIIYCNKSLVCFSWFSLQVFYLKFTYPVPFSRRGDRASKWESKQTWLGWPKDGDEGGGGEGCKGKQKIGESGFALARSLNKNAVATEHWHFIFLLFLLFVHIACLSFYVTW